MWWKRKKRQKKPPKLRLHKCPGCEEMLPFGQLAEHAVQVHGAHPHHSFTKIMLEAREFSQNPKLRNRRETF